MADNDAVLETGDFIAAGDAGAIHPAMVYDDKGPAQMSGGISAAGAVVESDGQTPLAEVAEEAAVMAQMQEISLVVEDIEAARTSILDLVQEYEGSVEEDGSDFYVNLPGGNAQEFVSAIAYLDRSGQSLEMETPEGDGTITLLLSLKQE